MEMNLQKTIKEEIEIEGIDLRNNIIKSYIIGKNISFFQKQLKKKVQFSISKNLKKAIDLVKKF